MEGFLSMSEIRKLSVIEALVKGRLTRSQAEQHLEMCRDSVWRLKKVYRERGAKGFAHGLRGKPSNHRSNTSLRDEVVELYLQEYAEHGFGIQHFLEEAAAELSQVVPYSTAWRWLRQSGAVRRRRRARRHHARRPRKECFGEMIQMDTSIHDWTSSGEKTCLVSAMDDATGRVVGARFFTQDTTLGNMLVIRDVLEQFGLPMAFYVDRSPIFKVTRTGEGAVFRKRFVRSGVTQVQRALSELGIELIHAYSPQAKGRIERSYGTWQDRLVSELSKNGIKDLGACNEYTQACFLPKFNARFSKDPGDFPNAFVPLRRTKLDFYLAEKFHRVVTNDHVVSCAQGGLVALIKPDQHRRCYARANVEVYRHTDHTHSILYQGRKLCFEPLNQLQQHV
jgi:hypothetical protein